MIYFDKDTFFGGSFHQDEMCKHITQKKPSFLKEAGELQQKKTHVGTITFKTLQYKVGTYDRYKLGYNLYKWAVQLGWPWGFLHPHKWSYLTPILAKLVYQKLPPCTPDWVFFGYVRISLTKSPPLREGSSPRSRPRGSCRQPRTEAQWSRPLESQ